MIRTEREGAIVRLLLDRPARKNAFDPAMAQALADALAAVEAAGEANVIVIKGAGEVFSTGRDLKASAEQASVATSEDEDWVRIYHLLHRSSIPSVAVVRGFAVAGGFTLAMGCDFVLAEKDAVFGAYEMKHGFPAAVCTPILAHKVGPRLGLEFAMFGEAISAERLHAAGLINRLADDAAALDAVEAKFVGHLARLDRTALKQTRDLFRAAAGMPLDNALDMGRSLNQAIAASGGFARAGEKLGKSK